MRKAWTMIELIMVIVIIGVLAGIAIPKFSDTKDAAEIGASKATIASVKTAIATERQLRVLRGDFTVISALNADGGAFSKFSKDDGGNGVSRDVLESTIPLCGTDEKGCWSSVANGAGTKVSPSVYTYKMPDGATVAFNLEDGRFKCDPSDAGCKKLTQ